MSLPYNQKNVYEQGLNSNLLEHDQVLNRQIVERLETVAQVVENQTAIIGRLLDFVTILTSSMIPSNMFSATITVVSNFAQELITNSTENLMRVVITNNDFAQQLTVSNSGSVMVGGGQIINPQANFPFVLSPGTSLYGIVAVPSIQVSVSLCYDLYRELKK